MWRSNNRGSFQEKSRQRLAEKHISFPSFSHLNPVFLFHDFHHLSALCIPFYVEGLTVVFTAIITINKKSFVIYGNPFSNYLALSSVGVVISGERQGDSGSLL